MRNSGLKKSKFIFIFFLLLLIKTNFVYSQDCTLEIIPAKGFEFKSDDPVTLIYDSLRANLKDELTIMLVNSFGQVNKKEIYFLTIQAGGNICAKHFDGKKNKSFGVDGKAYSQNLPQDSTSNNFYLGTCKSTVSSHKSSVLVIINAQRRVLIDCQSLDGRIIKTIRENNHYTYLNYALELLVKVFPNLKDGSN